MPDHLRGRRLIECLRRPVQNDQPSVVARTSWRFQRRRYDKNTPELLSRAFARVLTSRGDVCTYVCTRFRACVHFAWRVLVSCAPRWVQLCLLVFLTPLMCPRKMGLPFKSHRARSPRKTCKAKRSANKKEMSHGAMARHARGYVSELAHVMHVSSLCYRAPENMKKLCHSAEARAQPRTRRAPYARSKHRAQRTLQPHSA